MSDNATMAPQTPTAPVSIPTPVSVGNSQQAVTRELAIATLSAARENAAVAADAANAVKLAAVDTQIAGVSIDTAPDFNGGNVGLNYSSVYDSLSDDGKRLVGNLRADYTKKTQAISEQRKQIESDRKALLDSNFYADVSKQADVQTELNVFDTASVEARIQQEVAKRMKQMLEPMRKEAEITKRQYALDEFKRSNPDIEVYKKDIAKMLISDNTLSLERAYWIVKGQVTTERSRSTEAELAQYKKSAQEYGLKVGGASKGSANGVPDHVRKAGSYAIYQHLMSQKAGK